MDTYAKPPEAVPGLTLDRFSRLFLPLYEGLPPCENDAEPDAA